MDVQKHQQLVKLLSKIETSDFDRETFLSKPIETLNEAMQLGIDPSIDIGLANDLVLSILKNTEAIETINNLTTSYQAGDININTYRLNTAEALFAHATADVKDKLKKIWGGEPKFIPPRDEVDAPIANVAIAVDIVVVVTEAVAFNSEYVFSGNARTTANDINRIATVISKG
jgi:hypothetical protein